MPDTFTYHGEEIEYFDHMYNLTYFNERRVEMAIATRWLSERSGYGLEVGNVTGHYSRRTHPVWDLHEPAAWYQEHQPVRSVDILDPGPVMFAYDWVLSISTIEHTEDPVKAIEALRDLVAPGGHLLVTFPTGVHDDLDSLASWCDQTFDRYCTLVRVGDGTWGQSHPVMVTPYGPWANSVFIGEWERPA